MLRSCHAEEDTKSVKYICAEGWYKKKKCLRECTSQDSYVLETPMPLEYTLNYLVLLAFLAFQSLNSVRSSGSPSHQWAWWVPGSQSTLQPSHCHVHRSPPRSRDQLNQVTPWSWRAYITVGSLEVKFPTIWTDEKQRWEESEKRREEKRREEKISEEKKREEKISEEKEPEERRSRCAKR